VRDVQTRWGRRIGMSGSVGLLVLIGAACGSAGQASSVGKSTGTIALTSYRTTVARGSADIDSSWTMSEAHQGPTTMTSTGAYSWTSSRGEMTSQTGGADQSKEIIVGHDVYTQTSGAVPATVLGGGTAPTWSETTWSGSSAVTLFGSFLGTPGPADPATLLELLDSHASSISTIGTEEIGGVETTHYRAHIPLSRIGPSGASPAQFRQARQMLGVSSVSVDFWVDSSGLLRQLKYEMTIRQAPKQVPQLAPVLPMTMSMTVDLSHYGVPVTVTPPPASEVAPGGTCQTTSSGFTCTNSIESVTSGSSGSVVATSGQSTPSEQGTSTRSSG
jgi:hypothetical protein